MDKNLNKKILGFIGVSAILGSQYIDFKKNSLLLPKNERIIFCIDKQKTDCLNDHLESKFGIYSIVSGSTMSITTRFI